MDHCQSIPMKDHDDATTLRKLIEKEWIYDFLVGHWSEYDQVRGQIFDKDELPSLDDTIAIIWAKESRKDAMLND